MPLYVLTEEAENDLREIARYTQKKWGKKQLQIYRQKINSKLGDIAHGKTRKRSFSEAFPHLLVTRCEHHFIFYLPKDHDKPIIILAILHENMDMIARIKSRLTEDI